MRTEKDPGWRKCLIALLLILPLTACVGDYLDGYLGRNDRQPSCQADTGETEPC